MNFLISICELSNFNLQSWRARSWLAKEHNWEKTAAKMPSFQCYFPPFLSYFTFEPPLIFYICTDLLYFTFLFFIFYILGSRLTQLQIQLQLIKQDFLGQKIFPKRGEPSASFHVRIKQYIHILFESSIHVFHACVF